MRVVKWDRGRGMEHLFPATLLLRLDDLFDDLGLLHQERPKDPRLHTVSTPRAAVSSPHSLPRLGDSGILAWSQSGNSRESNATVAALGGGGKFSDVVVNKLSSWRLHDTPSVGGSVVRLAFAECDTLGHWMIRCVVLGLILTWCC